MSDTQLNEQHSVPMEAGPAPEPTQTVLGPGAQLAAQRQAKGYTVEQVANQLNLAPRQIQALEADNYAALPGIVIARGFIRAYAKLLKIDPEPLVSLMQGDAAPMESIQLKRALSGSFSESRLPPTVSSGLLSKRVIAASLLVVIVVGVFAVHWLGLIPGVPETMPSSTETGAPSLPKSENGAVSNNAAIADSNSSNEALSSHKITKDEIAAPIAPIAPEPPPAAASTSVQAQVQAPASVTLTPSSALASAQTAATAQKNGAAPVPPAAPANPQKTAPATPPITTATTPAPAVPKIGTAPNALASQATPRQPDSTVTAPITQGGSTISGKNMLVMKLREDSWVEIRGADNSVLISRLMKAGSTEMLSVTKPVSVTVGNVAGIDMTLRGNPVDLKSAAKNNVARLNLK